MRLFEKQLFCLAFTLSLSTSFASAIEPGFVKHLRKHISGVGKSDQPTLSVRDKWAVVISISHYQDPSIKPLRYAIRNAILLTRVLKNQNAGRFLSEHVLTLTDAQATKSTIEEAICGNWLTKKALPNDLIVLYICGRIVPSSDKSDVVFCAYDTLASEAELSGVSLKSLLKELKHKTQSKLILALLDLSPASKSNLTADVAANYSALNAVDANTHKTCFKAAYPTLDTLAKRAESTIFSANDLGKPSHESNSIASSYFIHHLAHAIEEGGGLTPIGAIEQYVVSNVENDVQQQLGKQQVPALFTGDETVNLKDLPLGIVTKNANFAANFTFGHPVDEVLALNSDLHGSNRKVMIASGSKGIKSLGASKEKNDDEEEGNFAKVDFAPYMSKMKKDIQAKWLPPRGFENRKIVVIFSILRNGLIQEPSIVESSGVDSVDNAALEALRLASPLEPLPKGAPQSIQIKYKFEWKVKTE